ncbi:hypothetical protein ACFL1P_01455 [Patescibacteria group bacterium]
MPNIKVSRNNITEDSSRDIFWSKVVFISANNRKSSSVLFCASKEYLENNNLLEMDGKMIGASANTWINLVIKKWKTLKNEIFNRKVHYDVYTNDPTVETEGLNFLLKKTPHASSIL